MATIFTQKIVHNKHHIHSDFSGISKGFLLSYPPFPRLVSILFPTGPTPQLLYYTPMHIMCCCTNKEWDPLRQPTRTVQTVWFSGSLAVPNDARRDYIKYPMHDRKLWLRS